MKECGSPDEVRQKLEEGPTRGGAGYPVADELLERGRRLVFRLLKEARVFCLTYDAAAKDILADMAFNEGRKDIGYRVLAQVNRLAPDEYFLMMKEARNG